MNYVVVGVCAWARGDVLAREVTSTNQSAAGRFLLESIRVWNAVVSRSRRLHTCSDDIFGLVTNEKNFDG